MHVYTALFVRGLFLESSAVPHVAADISVSIDPSLIGFGELT